VMKGGSTYFIALKKEMQPSARPGRDGGEEGVARRGPKRRGNKTKRTQRSFYVLSMWKVSIGDRKKLAGEGRTR